MLSISLEWENAWIQLFFVAKNASIRKESLKTVYLPHYFSYLREQWKKGEHLEAVRYVKRKWRNDHRKMEKWERENSKTKSVTWEERWRFPLKAMGAENSYGGNSVKLFPYWITNKEFNLKSMPSICKKIMFSLSWTTWSNTF